jgi:hypothetical protein
MTAHTFMQQTVLLRLVSVSFSSCYSPLLLFFIIVNNIVNRTPLFHLRTADQAAFAAHRR